jgi:hypothetical protein
MKGFIISYDMRMNEETVQRYHSGITPTGSSRGFMNTYTEHITSDKKKAAVFYRKSEAEKVCALFESVHQIGKVIREL